VIALGELKVPKELRPVVEEIVGITDSVCLSVLDEEYAGLARRAVAKLARKRPSPLRAGRRATWAAGVVYALGHVNFLSDPASQPCVTADQLSAAFGVAKSPMSSKARQVRDLRAALLQVAAKLAAEYPRLVFRHPDKVTQGWELARKQRAIFIEFFGSDLIGVPGPEVASRMNGFLTWYTRRVLEEAGSAASSLDADVAARTPAFSVPGDLAGAPTVALAYDETEDLTFLANFGLVREAFENPGLAADSEHRQAVLGYLKADSISALPFRRLAETDTARASQLFQHLLKKPSFSWERDGEALLRKHKTWCFGAEPQPPVTPLSSELAKALPSSR